MSDELKRLTTERDFYKKESEDQFNRKVTLQDALFTVLECKTLDEAKKVAEAALLERSQ